MFWSCLISSFIIVALGQPARVPELGILAAAFGFALFWRSMLCLERPRSRFLLAFVWFASVQMIQLSWMATIQYMGPLIVGVYLFLNLALGVQFGALSMYLNPLFPLRMSRALAMAGTWVLFEWVRLFPCTGFTWNPVGLFLSCSTYSMQWASLFGIYGLSFWVILVNLAALKLLIDPFLKRSALIFCILAALPYGFGALYLAYFDRGENSSLNAILVQTALMPEQKDYDSSQAYAFIPAVRQWERILETIRQNDQKKPDLIILPEGALPYGAYRCGYSLESVQRTWKKYFGVNSLSDFPQLAEPFAALERNRWRVTNAYWAQALANHYKADVIAGLDDEDFNAAFLFRPHGGMPQRYEKRILVPVGEYVPFRDIRLMSDFVARQFGIAHSFVPGKEARLLQGKIPLSVSICYEETFSELIREARLQGAELLINITNNAWFPSSKLAQQHFDHGRIRAVENGVSVLRACNTGITGGIDRFGRTIETIEPSEQGANGLAIAIPLKFHNTLYTLWGDAAILLLSGFFILIFLMMQPSPFKKENES